MDGLEPASADQFVDTAATDGEDAPRLLYRQESRNGVAVGALSVIPIRRFRAAATLVPSGCRTFRMGTLDACLDQVGCYSTGSARLTGPSILTLIASALAERGAVSTEGEIAPSGWRVARYSTMAVRTFPMSGGRRPSRRSAK